MQQQAEGGNSTFGRRRRIVVLTTTTAVGMDNFEKEEVIVEVVRLHQLLRMSELDIPPTILILQALEDTSQSMHYHRLQHHRHRSHRNNRVVVRYVYRNDLIHYII